MAGRVVVVGLGPGDPDLVTVATRAAIDVIPVRFVRTTRHPSAGAVGDAASFDAVYDSAATIDDVYRIIASTLAAAASEHGLVLYAVPGSPLVAERSVELLRSDPEVEVEVLPALSFLDLAWARLGVDPVAAGARLVDGHRFAVEAAGAAGPLLVAQCDTRLVLSDIKLAVDSDPGRVVVLQRLGLSDEAVTELDWADLDRSVEPDHLTCLWIPRLASPVAAESAALVELMRVLRQRCPWDREQTHESLARHLIEESYEVLDAIAGVTSASSASPAGEAGDAGEGREAGEGGEGREGAAFADLEEELGDLLFQVVFHAHLAAEEGWFDFADVARGVHDKLVARHPHVFGDDVVASAGDLIDVWERRKKVEKGRDSVMDGIPSALPSLLYAAKVQGRATAIGLDWADADAVWPAVDAELAELRAAVDAGDRPGVAAELGDVLFSVVNLARKLDVDAETALREAAGRFRRRVTAVEAEAGERGIDLAGAGPDLLDRLWDQAKRAVG